jgi:alpha,alpha-trehalase
MVRIDIGHLLRQSGSRLVRSSLPLLEKPGGIVGSTEESRGSVSPTRPLSQWAYPFGWAPHQMLVWTGLMRYGFAKEARRCAYRWLYTITANAADYNGTVPEKFDVVARTHQVFAEYGYVGTKFAYITREGFGWTNASFLIGLSLLDPRHRALLNNLVPPEGVNVW